MRAAVTDPEKSPATKAFERYCQIRAQIAAEEGFAESQMQAAGSLLSDDLWKEVKDELLAAMTAEDDQLRKASDESTEKNDVHSDQLVTGRPKFFPGDGVPRPCFVCARKTDNRVRTTDGSMINCCSENCLHNLGYRMQDSSDALDLERIPAED